MTSDPTVSSERASGAMDPERASDTAILKRASDTAILKRASDTAILKRASGATDLPGCIDRRAFLFAGAAAVSTLALSQVFGSSAAFAGKAKLAKYPKKKIAKLSKLAADTPVDFLYPNDDDTYARCFLVKLGEQAGGGVGPGRDVVAFSSLCPHMGGILSGSYKGEHKVAGPCPSHLTTFDLTRHGMVVAGHAVQSLPQIVLAVKGDNIFATGVAGLFFGGPKNPGMA